MQNVAVRNSRMKWSFCFKLLHKLYAINVNAVSNAEGFCGNERRCSIYLRICIYNMRDTAKVCAYYILYINKRRVNGRMDHHFLGHSKTSVNITSIRLMRGRIIINYSGVHLRVNERIKDNARQIYETHKNRRT